MKRVLLLVLMAVLSLNCASSANDAEKPMPRATYKGEVGASPVGVIPDAALRDAARNRDMSITIEYPTRGAANPLLVFSPGYGGSNDSYVGLSSYWASQGYVVIRISHADAGKIPREDIWLTQTEADRRNRVRDVTFVLDSLDSLEQRYPELAGKIDRAKIGVGGHSYGAYVAMLLAGVKTYPGGVSHADPRVKVAMAMSPQGPSETRGLTRESFADVRIPILYMTGTEDRGMTETETPEWRREAFELSPAGDKWLVVVQHARHGTFTGRYEAFIDAQERQRPPEVEPLPPGRRPDPYPADAPERRVPRAPGSAAAVRQRDLFGTIKSLSLAFWDAYLKGDAKGREALEQAGTGGAAEVKSK